MSLTLYLHPLASYCHKVLIALYENATPFQPRVIDLGNAESRAELLAVWPIGKFPVLRDEARERTVPESSTIIEYLAQYYAGPIELVPGDADSARQTRLRDRFFDLHVSEPMQKIVGDRLRPADSHDPFGVERAREHLRTACELIDDDMKTRTWAMGEAFTMADCAAAPALFYADEVQPLAKGWPNAKAYLDRLTQRASYARVLAEAGPYFHLFPQ
ncbi:MAG: glutathione S-transferase family protein [Rhodanobacteraceae bacterium]